MMRFEPTKEQKTHPWSVDDAICGGIRGVLVRLTTLHKVNQLPTQSKPFNTTSVTPNFQFMYILGPRGVLRWRRCTIFFSEVPRFGSLRPVLTQKLIFEEKKKLLAPNENPMV